MPSLLLRTTEAIADLDGIWDYISRDSVEAADRVLDELYKQFALLGKFPEIGELQPLLGDGTFRRFVHRKYVIYYRPVNDGIVIVRIFHGA
jgi:toxin ParE1/3/4